MTNSYWHLINASPGPPRLADLDKIYDIAVIGAGIVGVALGYFLQRMGCANVIILEKSRIGYGASGRNAGFLISGMSEPYSRLVVGMGRSGAKELTQATLENHDLIEAAIKENDISCNYMKSGSFHLAVSEVERKELDDSVNLLLKDGFRAELFGEEINTKLRFGEYCGGYFNPSDGCLDPYALVRGLATGLNVAEGFDVRGVSRNSEYIELSDGKSDVRAEMAVIATNAYAPLLDDYFSQLVFPVRGQMLATDSGHLNPLEESTYYANFGYDYFRQPSKGVIMMGGLRNRFIKTEVGYEDSTTAELQQGLDNYVDQIVGFERHEVAARWSGIMGNTIDGLPLVGTLPHNNAVIAVVGCNGHGFGLGMKMAYDLSRAILTSETSDLLSRFSLKRFLR